jgi:hypothetical protein
MKRASVRRNKVFVALFVALISLSTPLMFFGRSGSLAFVGRALFMFAAGVGLVWAIFFAPTRQEMQEYREHERTRS